MVRRWIGMAVLFGCLVFAGCTGADDEELADYVDQLQADMDENVVIEEAIEAYVQLIFDSEPEGALDILNDNVIPGYEAIVKKYEQIELDHEDAVATNEIIVDVFQSDLDKQLILREIFEEMLEKADDGSIATIDLDEQMETLEPVNEGIQDVMNDFKENMVNLAEKYEFIMVDEAAYQEPDASQMMEDDQLVIQTFVDGVTKGDSNEKSEEEPAGADDEKNNAKVEQLLEDQGNPQIILDAAVEIDDTFTLTGQSNLPEGSTVYLQSFHYGFDNPFLKEELEVDAEGNFGLTLDLDKEGLTGDPLTLQLSYQPNQEDAEAQAIYGAQGEKIEGPFKHQFSSEKQKHYGAFTFAQVKVKEGENALFDTKEWEKPDDYGSLDIWMEEESVETHEAYYDITMNSNLNVLTGIKAEARVPGQDSQGSTSRTTVMSDGSFRLQVPRPEVDFEDVTVVIETISDRVPETEELYGERGENFEGDLVEEVDYGKEIVYELPLGDDA